MGWRPSFDPDRSEAEWRDLFLGRCDMNRSLLATLRSARDDGLGIFAVSTWAEEMSRRSRAERREWSYLLIDLLIVGCLVWWARSRKVAGSDPLMRLITTRDGFVSLSQFQIVMWSLLFGAGAIYVMGLSGSLIDIPTGALSCSAFPALRLSAPRSTRRIPRRQRPGRPRPRRQQCAPGP